MMSKSLTAFLLLSSLAWAEPPVPKIDGPTDRNPGALTFLDASGSAGAEKFAWLVDTSAVIVPKESSPDVSQTLAVLRDMGFEVTEPEDDSEPLWAVSEDGKRLWLSSYPGVYVVTLGVSNADGISLLPWKVTVSGVIPVPPVVVPPIVVVPPVVVPSDWAARLTASVKSNPAAAVGFTRVANTYATVADQIKPGLLTTPQQVTGLTNALTTVACPEWAAIEASIVQPHLKTLNLTTAVQYEQPWRDISVAVKAGLTDIPPPVVVDPPLPVNGLHVLIVEEMDDRSTLPASQVSIFSSTVLRKWLTDNNVQWRMFDDDVPQEQLEKTWKDALARPRASLPWILASNGTKGFEGPLPKTDAELITLLEKYK